MFQSTSQKERHSYLSSGGKYLSNFFWISILYYNTGDFFNRFYAGAFLIIKLSWIVLKWWNAKLIVFYGWAVFFCILMIKCNIYLWMLIDNILLEGWLKFFRNTSLHITNLAIIVWMINIIFFFLITLRIKMQKIYE